MATPVQARPQPSQIGSARPRASQVRREVRTAPSTPSQTHRSVVSGGSLCERHTRSHHRSSAAYHSTGIAQQLHAVLCCEVEQHSRVPKLDFFNVLLFFSHDAVGTNFWSKSKETFGTLVRQRRVETPRSYLSQGCQVELTIFLGLVVVHFTIKFFLHNYFAWDIFSASYFQVVEMCQGRVIGPRETTLTQRRLNRIRDDSQQCV